MEDKVFCPLIGTEIDVAVCFDICMVVDDGAPKWTAPAEAFTLDGYEETCSNCPNHRDD